MLEQIQRANLFVCSLDDRREWYRYHHLFAEALRALLERQQPEVLAQLHLRASCWLAEHDRLEEAIPHAIHAQDWVRVATLIEHYVTSNCTGIADETGHVNAWRAQLPTDILDAHPALLQTSGRSLPQKKIKHQRQHVQGLLEDVKDAPRRQQEALIRDVRQHLVEPLSERELEVLSFIAQGVTNADIAKRLYITVGTVKQHVGNILAKLGVSNRTQAQARAREIGLL